MFADDELIPISALAQYVYCPRRAALIFLEQQWADNVFTVEGRHTHERVHKSARRKERIPGGYLIRGLVLKSDKLGLIGAADAVEFHEDDPAGLKVVVVEYKRGKHRSFGQLEYHVQVCAQVLCLEEMLGLRIPQGALYFAKSNHRFEVPCDETLRSTVAEVARKVRDMLARAETPKANPSRKCRGCSLIDTCLPRVTSRGNVESYLKRMIGS